MDYILNSDIVLVVTGEKTEGEEVECVEIKFLNF
jgi:hypothetical protein